MAPTLESVNAEKLALSVQELAIKADSPPGKYVVKDNLATAATLPFLEITKVDIALLSSSSPEAEEEFKKLRAALSSSGYIEAVNYGMPPSFLDELHDVTRQFFSLPIEEKKKYARSSDGFDGYGNDVVYSENQTLDWNDRLYLHVYPENLRRFEKWPKIPENFSKILFEFTDKLQAMNDVLLKGMAKSLELDENCFVDQFGENPIVLSRFNLYPPCPRPDLVLALKPHGDGSGITHLLQDKEVEGLQVLKGNEWYRVPVTPHSLIINVGDQLEIMTNGIFKSPIHRVVTNENRERMTVGFFFAPDRRIEVKPAEGLIDHQNPKRYTSVVDYSSNYSKHTQEGRRPIDALKI